MIKRKNLLILKTYLIQLCNIELIRDKNPSKYLITPIIVLSLLETMIYTFSIVLTLLYVTPILIS